MTAEMVIVKTDLVETYVPIMNGDRFLGAIEIYYDITTSNNKITALTRHSLALLSGLAFILLSLLYYALHHADLSIRAREKAENDLRLANEDLEQRVADRAGELVDANTNLTREIAERTLAQMALSEALAEMRQDKEKISGILRSVDDGLLVIDSNNHIVMMNAPAEKILAVRQKDVIGTPLSQAITNRDLFNKFSDLLFSETMPHIDFKSPSIDLNKESIFQTRTSKLRDEDGSVHGRIILMQDVTQERRLDQMKSDFLAMAAHELSTPLATIIGYADLLSGEHVSDLTPEVQRESLNFIHEKANALSRIIDDLLDISRAESGQELSINKVPFNLHRTLETIVSHYTQRHSDHSIKLVQPVSNGDIIADPTRIGQVLDNLMSNAIKYTPAGGHIEIKSIIDGDFYQIEINDDGVGMNTEQLEHIFDKFYRADASNTAKPGIGLGMSITRHIIEGHGGTITVYSEPGRGTQVAFRLPRAVS
jgi:PAS domain S-box-containing protein